MAALLWLRLVFLVVLAAVVGLHAWTAYRASEDGKR
jgi:hypothetical protein